MKKILLIIAILIGFCSCNNDEPEVNKKPEFCAVTWFENIIKSNNLHYTSVIYNERGFCCFISDFDDEYFNNFDIYHANLMYDNDISDFSNKISRLFNIDFYYNGYSECVSCNHNDYPEHRNWPSHDIPRMWHIFKGSIYGDYIKIITMPNHKTHFVSISIECQHECYKYKDLK